MRINLQSTSSTYLSNRGQLSASRVFGLTASSSSFLHIFSSASTNLHFSTAATCLLFPLLPGELTEDYFVSLLAVGCGLFWNLPFTFLFRSLSSFSTMNRLMSASVSRYFPLATFVNDFRSYDCNFLSSFR